MRRSARADLHAASTVPWGRPPGSTAAAVAAARSALLGAAWAGSAPERRAARRCVGVAAVRSMSPRRRLNPTGHCQGPHTEPQRRRTALLRASVVLRPASAAGHGATRAEARTSGAARAGRNRWAAEVRAAAERRLAREVAGRAGIPRCRDRRPVGPARGARWRVATDSATGNRNCPSFWPFRGSRSSYPRANFSLNHAQSTFLWKQYRCLL